MDRFLPEFWNLVRCRFLSFDEACLETTNGMKSSHLKNASWNFPWFACTEFQDFLPRAETVARGFDGQ
jgi:hypothetical protein